MPLDCSDLFRPLVTPFLRVLTFAYVKYLSENLTLEQFRPVFLAKLSHKLLKKHHEYQNPVGNSLVFHV